MLLFLWNFQLNLLANSGCWHQGQLNSLCYWCSSAASAEATCPSRGQDRLPGQHALSPHICLESTRPAGGRVRGTRSDLVRADNCIRRAVASQIWDCVADMWGSCTVPSSPGVEKRHLWSRPAPGSTLESLSVPLSLRRSRPEHSHYPVLIIWTEVVIPPPPPRAAIAV